MCCMLCDIQVSVIHLQEHHECLITTPKAFMLISPLHEHRGYILLAEFNVCYVRGSN